MLGIPKGDRDIRSVRQRLDKGENLHSASEAGRKVRWWRWCLVEEEQHRWSDRDEIQSKEQEAEGPEVEEVREEEPPEYDYLHGFYCFYLY